MNRTSSTPVGIVALAALLVLSSSAEAIPTLSRDQIIAIAKSGVGSPYVWGGTCWNPANRSWKGPDCSGFVTKCWQIPATSKTTDCLPHYYTTSTFQNATTHWTKISRNDLARGDALVYNSGSAGHVVLYESGDKWGNAQVYEARGSAYGVMHRTKNVESKYVARRRNSIGAPAPVVPKYPLMTISASIATIGSQARDYCKQGKSTGIFDWKIGQTTKVNIDIKNSGTAVATDVQIGIWSEQPYLTITHWNIYSNWKNASFALNDTDGMQSIGHDNPSKTFTLKIGAMSIGETKRIVLTVKALKFSIDAADHPDVRAWVAKVANYYSKSGFSGTPNNVSSYQKQNGGDLRAYAQTDVFGPEVCDGKDNDCDGQTDEGGVCAEPDPPPAPTPDQGGTVQNDAGVPTADTVAPEPSLPGEPGDPGEPEPPQGSPPPINADGADHLQGSCAVAPRGSSAGLLPLLLLGLACLVTRRRRR